MSLFRLPSEFIPQTQSSLFLAIWKRYSVNLKKLLSFKESGCCNLRFNTSYRLKVPKTKWVSKDPWRQELLPVLAPHRGTFFLRLSVVSGVFRVLKHSPKSCFSYAICPMSQFLYWTVRLQCFLFFSNSLSILFVICLRLSAFISAP